jgi:hypothetical protein
MNVRINQAGDAHGSPPGHKKREPIKALLKRQNECHGAVAGWESTWGTSNFRRIVLALFY